MNKSSIWKSANKKSFHLKKLHFYGEICEMTLSGFYCDLCLVTPQILSHPNQVIVADIVLPLGVRNLLGTMMIRHRKPLNIPNSESTGFSSIEQNRSYRHIMNPIFYSQANIETTPKMALISTNHFELCLNGYHYHCDLCYLWWHI